jgi:DNA-binding transcriptional LysR family regulator
MLDPASLQAFVTIADEGQFVRAADALGCTQSVVSKRLRRLEDQLGTRLLKRNKRSKVELTQEGIQFLQPAKHMLDELGRVEEAGRRIALGELGSLRIGYVLSTVMTGLLPMLIRHFRQRLPELEIVPTAMETPEQLSALGKGRLDIALVRPRPSYPVGARAKTIHSENVLLAIPGDSPFAQASQLRCADLAGSRFIVPQFHEEVGLIDVISSIARTGRFNPPPVIKTSDFVTTAGLVAAGMGVAPVPASLRALTLEGLIYMPITDLSSAMTLVLIEAPHLPPSIRDAIASFAGTCAHECG